MSVVNSIKLIRAGISILHDFLLDKPWLNMNETIICIVPTSHLFMFHNVSSVVAVGISSVVAVGIPTTLLHALKFPF
jgi:hypothetical protein